MPVRFPTTVLMPFFNHLPTTIQSVNALLGNPDLPTELVLIDGGSAEDIENRAREIINPANIPIKLVQMRQNGGFVQAVNAGFTHTESPFVVLLDNDAIPLPDWLSSMHAVMDRFPDAGAVGSKLLTKEYRVEEAGSEVLYDGATVQLGAGLDRYDPGVSLLRRVSYCSGASLMVRRSALGFTPEEPLLQSVYGRGCYADADLGERLRLNGYSVYYQPRSEVVHLGDHSIGKSAEHERLRRRNRKLYCEKWMDRLSQRLADTLTVLDDNRGPVPLREELPETLAPAVRPPKVTIIILCWNGLEYTKQAISSVQASTWLDYVLVPVDNGSTDGTPDYLRCIAERHPEIRPVFLERNFGFAGGMNAGLATVATEFAAILNNDVVVTPGWLERMLVHFYQFPALGLIGPMACNVSGVQNIPFTYSLDALDHFARKTYAENAGSIATAQRIVGFAWAARLEVLHKVGGFHLDFGKGNYEDDDYCIRVLNAGYQIAVAPDVFIYHKGSASWDSDEWRHSMEVNLQVLHKRWGRVWTSDGYWIERTPEAYLRSRDYFPPVRAWADMREWLRQAMDSSRDADVAHFALQSFTHTGSQLFILYAALSALRLELAEQAIRIILAAPTDRLEVESLKLWASVLALYSLGRTEDMRQAARLAQESGFALPQPPDSRAAWDLQWRDLQTQCEGVF